MDHILLSNAISIRQNNGGFVISNGEFTRTYFTPSKDGTDAGISLQTFCDDIGVPVNLKTDLASSFAGKKTHFQDVVYKNRIRLTHAKAGRKNELYKVDTQIRELKRRIQNKAAEKNVPRRIWDFLAEHQSQIMSFIPQGPSARTGYGMVTGQTPDISEFLDFDFYDLVWYHVDQHASTGTPNRKLARWVGVAHRIGTALCYWLLPVSGRPIAETTVQHVTAEDLRNPDIKAQVDEFNENLNKRLSDENFQVHDDFYVEDFYDEFDEDDINLTNYGKSGLDFYSNDNDPAYGDEENTPPDAEYEMSRQKPEIDDIDNMDQYIGAKIVLDQNNPGNLATVKRRVTDFNGRPVGRAHANPMLDTQEYEVLSQIAGCAPLSILEA